MAIHRGPPGYTQLEWIATLGGMVKHGTQVQASCPACGAVTKVDLQRLIETLGADASLIDRRPPCKRRDCEGRVLFQARVGSNGFRPCKTD